MSDLKKVLGYKIGDFDPQDGTGKKVHYTHLYVCFPKDEVTGLTVDIFKCLNDDVIKDIKPGDFVKAYFNENKKVQLLMPEEPTEEDLSVFSEIITFNEAVFAFDKFDKQSDEQADEQADKQPEG